MYERNPFFVQLWCSWYPEKRLMYLCDVLFNVLVMFRCKQSNYHFQLRLLHGDCEMTNYLFSSWNHWHIKTRVKARGLCNLAVKFKAQDNLSHWEIAAFCIALILWSSSDEENTASLKKIRYYNSFHFVNLWLFEREHLNAVWRQKTVVRSIHDGLKCRSGCENDFLPSVWFFNSPFSCFLGNADFFSKQI